MLRTIKIKLAGEQGNVKIVKWKETVSVTMLIYKATLPKKKEGTTGPFHFESNV